MDFAWVNVGGLDPTNHMLVVPAGCRMDPPGTVWDLGGFQITESDVAGVLPDSLLFGGAALSGGLPAGALETLVQFNFVVTSPTAQEDIYTLCIDSCKIGAGEFVFVGSSTIVPTVGWPTGGYCLPTHYMPNMCPVISGGTAMTVNHCGQNSVTLTATDAEGNTISWGIAGNTGAGVATMNNGVVTYTPANADVGSSVVITAFATDAFHDAAGCAFHDINVTVTNTAPTVNCGQAMSFVGKGNVFTKTDITAADADACDALVFSLAAGVVGDMAIDPVSGDFSWTTQEADAGMVFPVTVNVFDGFTNATCVFEVEVLSVEPYEIHVDKVHDVYQGTYVDVPVRMTLGSEAMGGFDFLLAYDNTALTFTGATLGSYLVGCDWEYFTYRYGAHGNCGDGCPSGEIRLVGLAETNNGPYHPDFTCIKNMSGTDEVIANLTFFVTTDVNFNDYYAAVKFLWMDCGDNTISVASGDTLAISRFVYNYYGTGGVDSWIDVTDETFGFPGTYGAPVACEVFTEKGAPVRFADFYNGGVDIIDKDDIDDRGDINMNGLANEIADAVMFTNYFIFGESAFGTHVAGSIAASDINADGTPLTIADLVYLTRVIVGDALPYPKPAPGALFTAVMQGDELTVNTTEDAGAALFVFNVDGTVGTPTINGNMDIISNVEGNELRVLVYNIGSERLTDGTVLNLDVNGSVELVEVVAATYDGADMQTSTRVLPTAFTVAQNYPNPFNPKTMISFGLSVASDWTVEIYNIAGQKVNSFNGFSQAGPVQVEWNATDANGSSVASGIYFYKVSAGANSATMKMVLLK
ncbi:MAG: T9SS type A sorting domain-containing protein [Candidatus Zixiibacteriota bacterium]